MTDEIMMRLQDRLLADLQDAIRARDGVRRAALRAARAALAEAEHKAGRPLSDPDALNVVAREVVIRREAVAQYAAMGRADLVATEQAALTVIEQYLPPPLSEEELRTTIAEVISSCGATGPSAIGVVMKELVPRIRGRADAGLAKEIAVTLLTTE